MNEPDAYALEEALRLREKHGGEVVVCSAGPARVQTVIREALARGADRAIHVEDDSLGAADAFVIADALAAAMKDEKFDLVLTGLQSDDQGHGQTGVILAERLGIPSSTIIMEVQIEDALAACEARARGRLVPVDRDAAAGAAHDPERHQPAPLRHAEGHHGGQEEGDPKGGAADGLQPSQQIVSLAVPTRSKQTQMIAGSPADAAKELVRRLREEARAL